MNDAAAQTQIPSQPTTMTSSKASFILFLLFSVLLGKPTSIRAGILNSQEQGLANLLISAGGQQRNRGAMQVDAALTAVARAKARDMATRRYFDHTTPDGKGPNFLVRAAGFPLPLWWGTARTDNNVESISAGYGTALSAWNALMASPGHRSHLLATDSFYKDQTSYGIGYYYDRASPFWHYFVIITAPPRAKSTLTISSPASGAKIGTDEIAVTGTVGGSGVVTSADIRLENSAGSSAWTRIPLPDGAGVGGWRVNMGGLLPGNNTIRVRSYYLGTNLLAEVVRTVRWVVLRPITVAVDGAGKVSTGYIGTTQREVGVNLTISAAPLDESTLFSHWTGLPVGANANAAKQTFTMTEGLSLVAHFVPNPFWTRRGAFQGVLAGQQLFNSGQLKISVSASGAFSGKLYYANGTHTIRGTLNANGEANLQIKRGGGNEIGLAIALDVTGTTNRITGTVNEYGMITALTADRRAEAGEAFSAGQITIKIAPDAAVPTSPRGNGYALVRIKENGTVKMAGTLADGRAFTASSIVSQTGGIPVYTRLFKGSGGIVGTASLVNTAISDIDGSVRYFKPERPLDKYYPQAFTLVNAISGSRYMRPLKGEPFINFQTSENRGRLLLSQGNIGEQITQPLEVGTDNSIALQTPTYTGMKVSMNINTGRFSGSFVHPVAGVRKFSGIVMQKQRTGWGFFLGVDQGGATLLQPLP